MHLPDFSEVNRVSSDDGLIRQVLKAGIFFYTILLFLSLFSGVFYLRIVLAALSFSFFIFLIFFSVNLNRSHVLYFSLIFLMGIVTFERSEGSSLVAALFLAGGFAMAVIIRDFDFGSLAFKYPLLGFLSYLYFCWLFLGFGPGEFNEVFIGYSRNIVGAMVLALLGGYLWLCYEKDVRPSVLILLFSALITIPLYGRSNIAALALLLLFFLFFSSKHSISFALLSLAALLTLGFGPEIGEYLSSRTNFSAGIESPRFEMVSGYIEQLDLPSMFLGGDEQKVSTIVQFGGNPHNAFIRFHSNFGFMLFFSVFFLLLTFTRFLSSSSGFLLVLLSVMLFRAFFDVIFFGNFFDYAILGPLAYFYKPEYKALVFAKV